ncbi:condensation domain-containing protein [Oscillatoria acuminata]|uniref:Acyl-CoA synthetase (AMP-forming)/AMP-acid ligase II n=1 Tax=Oscillatoria acuminata PCC 6304 TaxID=56110 RepID=K9TK97_9CYAN|nr:condensation domain-containing protein [Oscillatoria acuminata]AFY82813.1 acyl-CoA synthetase (AMP-forming)/AMP-acid ligase II [Oscillatoria acuminata PCC 6304]
MNYAEYTVPQLDRRCSTFVEILRGRAIQQPDNLAFRFLIDGEILGETLTYRELDRGSRAIAAQLQAMGLGGERALLLYPPGLDYLIAFFGCLYAGVVAVPAYPPRNQRNTPRILAVLADAKAAVALTTSQIAAQVQSLLSEKTAGSGLQWVCTDRLDPALDSQWQDPGVTSDSLAFLQYTSGSTGTPKGVMVSQGNLLHNAAITYKVMDHHPESQFISWLPTYHDMGLIGGILQPLYGGFPCTLMSPASFLQRPYRWLKAISDYGGTTSGAPNFAYDLCVSKITPEQKATLDLSRWQVAFNGAEPIRHETLVRFQEAFADCGFQPEAFYPCYGMAETTLMVSGSMTSVPYPWKAIDKGAFERNQITDSDSGENAVTLVGCGSAVPDMQIAIAHPETGARCAGNEVGEVWVSGPSVCQGYWNRPEESRHTFQAFLADSGEGPFLRTGDLGFLEDGELYITGRVKDLILIRGRNLYPQDIERATESSHRAFRLTGTAAFTVEVAGEERLVVVQELEFRAKPNLSEAIAAIRQAVAEEFEVQVYGVVLIKPGTIPKTSSGKIQRRACRDRFLNGELQVVDQSLVASSMSGKLEKNWDRESLLNLAPEQRQTELIADLTSRVSSLLNVSVVDIDPKQPLSRFGLDSLMAFDLKNQLELAWGVNIDVVDFFEGISLVELAQKADNLLETQQPIDPIEPVSRTAELPVGLAQERLWFLDRLEPGNPFYNVAFCLNIVGKLDTKILESSLQELVNRHEGLRTGFPEVKGRPIQQIQASVMGGDFNFEKRPNPPAPFPAREGGERPNPPAPFPKREGGERDLFPPPLVGEGGRGERSHLFLGQIEMLPVTVKLPISEVLETEVSTRLQQEAKTPFNLSQAPLLRVHLFRVQDQRHCLSIVLHHIISDGWSVGVMVREIAAIYEALTAGQAPNLGNLPIQYADFAAWQRQQLQTEGLQRELDYWKQQLQGNLSRLNLPCDRPRPEIPTFAGQKCFFQFSPTLSEAVRELNRQEEVTLFMTLLAGFKILLCCYSQQEDIAVGSPVAGREKPETRGLIGFFINTLVLRTDLSGNPNFREVLQRVRAVASGAYAHQALPFDKLVEELQPERNLSYNPLFQVMFILQNAPIPTVEIPGLSFESQEVDLGTSKFDLKVSIWDDPAGFKGSFEYQTDLFNPETIAQMVEDYEGVLHQVVTQPHLRLTELNVYGSCHQQRQRQAESLQAVSLQKLKLTKRQATRTV